jgi:hypothetical protein
MTQSIPPATNLDELRRQKCRFSFIKAFELLCCNPNCPNEAMHPMPVQERASALDSALNEFLESAFILHNVVRSCSTVDSRPPLVRTYIRLLEMLDTLRLTGEADQRIEGTYSQSLFDIRQEMTPNESSEIELFLVTRSKALE